MNDNDKLDRIAHLLEQVRDNQKALLEQQSEALSIQREQFEVVLQQHHRATSIQDRAEALQNKSSQIIGTVRGIFPFILAVIVALIAYVTWLLFRMGTF